MLSTTCSCVYCSCWGVPWLYSRRTQFHERPDNLTEQLFAGLLSGVITLCDQIDEQQLVLRNGELCSWEQRKEELFRLSSKVRLHGKRRQVCEMSPFKRTSLYASRIKNGSCSSPGCFLLLQICLVSSSSCCFIIITGPKIPLSWAPTLPEEQR